MKQTAVEKMIQYFIKQKNNGASHWCIDDLIAQLHQAKAMEKEQIKDALQEFLDITLPDEVCEKYYNETFKSE
jgi:hypothetical protein